MSHMSNKHRLLPAATAVLWLSLVLLAPSFGVEPVVGVTEPIKDETLSSLVAGAITAIHFKEGDRVEKGAMLVELNRVFEELETKRRKLIWENKAELTSAEAKVETVKTDLDGTQRIYDTTKSISLDELNKKKLEHTMAQAELDQLRIAEEKEQIEYEMACEQLLLRTIKAPLDGVVAEVHREVGENCQPHEPLVRIVDSSKCHLVANVEADLVRALSVGQEIPLEILVGPEPHRCQGAISFISPVVDAASRLQKVKVLFDNADGHVYPGVAGRMLLPAQ